MATKKRPTTMTARRKPTVMEALKTGTASAVAGLGEGLANVLTVPADVVGAPWRAAVTGGKALLAGQSYPQAVKAGIGSALTMPTTNLATQRADEAEGAFNQWMGVDNPQHLLIDDARKTNRLLGTTAAGVVADPFVIGAKPPPFRPKPSELKVGPKFMASEAELYNNLAPSAPGDRPVDLQDYFASMDEWKNRGFPGDELGPDTDTFYDTEIMSNPVLADSVHRDQLARTDTNSLRAEIASGYSGYSDEQLLEAWNQRGLDSAEFDRLIGKRQKGWTTDPYNYSPDPEMGDDDVVDAYFDDAGPEWQNPLAGDDEYAQGVGSAQADMDGPGYGPSGSDPDLVDAFETNDPVKIFNALTKMKSRGQLQGTVGEAMADIFDSSNSTDLSGLPEYVIADIEDIWKAGDNYGADGYYGANPSGGSDPSDFHSLWGEDAPAPNRSNPHAHRTKEELEWDRSIIDVDQYPSDREWAKELEDEWMKRGYPAEGAFSHLGGPFQNTPSFQELGMNRWQMDNEAPLAGLIDSRRYPLRVRERPKDWRPVVLDYTRGKSGAAATDAPLGSYTLDEDHLRPEESALIKEAVERIADTHPNAPRLISRIEVRNNNTIDQQYNDGGTTAYYVADEAGSRIVINNDLLRTTAKSHGVDSAYGVLSHEINHAAQNFLGMFKHRGQNLQNANLPYMERPTEYMAFARESQNLGYPAAPHIPLTPHEMRTGKLAAWRTAEPPPGRNDFRGLGGPPRPPRVRKPRFLDMRPPDGLDE